jgi:DNA-binding MurR/RpiR family transcriptional regulator
LATTFFTLKPDLKPSPSSPMLLPQRLDLHNETLTASERVLADSMRAHYPNGLLDSASMMAASVGTSASTVVRFFAKLGYPSMAEVRREARSQLTKLMQTPSQRSQATMTGERSLTECVDDTLMHDQYNLQATYQGLDWEALEAFVQKVCTGKGRIYVAAGNQSLPISMYLSSHLSVCRPNVLDLSTVAPSIVDQLLWVAPEDVLLVFSIRRYASESVQAAQHFHAHGAQVLAITDSPTSPVVHFANHWLRVETGNASPFDSYTAAIFLCNALISAVTQELKAQTDQALQKRDAMWDAIAPKSEWQREGQPQRRQRKPA